jgi:hypothetical protein
MGKNLFFLLFLVVFTIFTGCDAEIGDDCSSSVDCASNGTRICDRTMTNGYCTIEGCNSSSCPSEAVCVAFYPVTSILVDCDPITEDAYTNGTDDCLSSELCLSSGKCAPVVQEKRYCMKKCSKDSDCRGGYECRDTGEYGSQKVPGSDQTYGEVSVSGFCVAEIE